MKANDKQQIAHLRVTDELTVAIIPHEAHEYLITTAELAKGYGTTKYAVQKNFQRNLDEFKNGKHFLTGADILKGMDKTSIPKGTQPNAVYWTKRGVIRMGLHIKTPLGIIFRDFAEELTLQKLSTQQIPQPIMMPPAKKRNHNRLTQSRLVEILADVARIDDKEIRLSLIEKLGL